MIRASLTQSLNSVRFINIFKNSSLSLVKSRVQLKSTASSTPPPSTNASFSAAQKMYAAKIDSKAKEDFEQAQKVKRYHRILGLALGAFVLSIYAYTMLAIKQEKFLDDFEVPTPPAGSGYEEAAKGTGRAH